MKELKVFLLAVFILTSGFLWADEGDDPLLQGIEFYLSGRTGEAEKFFRAVESDYPESFSLFSSRDSVFFQNYFISGRIRLWQGRIALRLEDETAAEIFLNRAVEIGESLGTAIAGEGKPDLSMLMAEAYRLQADGLAEIMLFKGVPYIIRNGSRVQELAEKALELDPLNPDAGIIFAQGRINAPRIFGGNRKEGLRIIENILSRSSSSAGGTGPGGGEGVLSKPQAFRALLSLGDALKDKDPALADVYYRRADTLYPGNPFTTASR